MIAPDTVARVQQGGDMKFEGRALRWVRHLLCVLALAWTGLVNGQPFFFFDTSNYIRAADIAVHVASGRRISTEWTDRYRATVAPPTSASASAAAAPDTPNNVGNGTIMAGRSPYFGALLWLSYVIGDFWPFVLLNAAISYFLILLTLRCFRLTRPWQAVLSVGVLAFATSLPTYNSLLLADPYAPFGVLAFLLLASPHAFSRRETAGLVALILASASFHLTHIMMLLGMLAILLAIHLARIAPLAVPRRAWVAGIAGVLVGVASVQATALATSAVFGRAPQLLPLLTARFYIDGPGKRFIEAGCDGGRFAVCRVPIVAPPSDALWLFSMDRHKGAYMLASPEDRRRMGEEDVAFALAVLRREPVRQAGMMALNTLRQFVWIDYDGLNTRCLPEDGECWEALPPTVRARHHATPSGRNAWPQAAMNAVLYGAVLASLAVIAGGLRSLRRRDPDRARLATLWLIGGGAAFLTNAFFGGAVADPQYRYTGRMIWLVVLLALAIGLRWWSLREPRGWQGSSDSNRGPSVLETDALTN